MANYSNKILKGDELYYYTLKLKARLASMDASSAAMKEELQGNIDALEQKVDQNKQDTDAAIQELETAYDNEIQNLEDTKLELKVALSADYDGEQLVKMYSDIDKTQEIQPGVQYLYLVPPVNPKGEDEQNIYNEYIWTQANGYELIGSAEKDNLSVEEVEEIWNTYFNN